MNEITGWTPRLQKAVDDARRLTSPDAPTRINDQPLFRDKTGAPISESARKSAWRRIINKAKEEGLSIDGRRVYLKESFTYHDIKAKGVTDHDSKASGHRKKKCRPFMIENQAS